MSLGIVEGLEVVQIDELQCPHASAACTDAQSLIQSINHQAAVGELRQGVVERQLVDLFFGSFALGDVT